MAVKEISISDRFEFYFPHTCSAVLVADVDEDQEEEILAASRNGFLFIFRFGEQKPFSSACDLGLVTALAAGDIFNKNRCSLCCISSDGFLNVFQVSPLNQDYQLAPVYCQLLPSNIKVACIEDIDGDGQQELLIGLTDRIIRSYRYVIQQKETTGRLVALSKWELPLQITALSLKCQWRDLKLHLDNSDFPACPSRLLVSQSGSRYVIITPSSLPKESPVTRDITDAVLADASIVYQLSTKSSTQQQSDPNRSLTTGSSLSSDPLFLYYESSAVSVFHAITDTVAIVSGEKSQQQETIIRFPRPVFSLAMFGKVIDSSRILCGCDWNGHVYFTSVSCRKSSHSLSSEGSDQVFHHLSLRIPITMFTAHQLTSMNTSILLLCSKPDSGLMAFWIDKSNLR